MAERVHVCNGEAACACSEAAVCGCEAAHKRGSDGRPRASAYAMSRPPARVANQPYATAGPPTNREVMAKLPVPAEVMAGQARPRMQWRGRLCV